MFFLIFPAGVRGQRIRPVVAFVIAGVLLYRALMSIRFPQLRVQLLTFFPVASWDSELLSAMLQSLVTPSIPVNAVLEHQALLVMATVMILIFWLVFGGGLETHLGRLGLGVFYLLGSILGLILLMTPGVSMSASFWLGNTAALFCIGSAYLIFLDQDVKLYYVFWSIFTGGRSGVWEVPSLFFLIPAHGIIMMSQSMFWYSVPSPVIPTHDGLFTPLAWGLVVPMLGFGATLAWAKVGKKPALPRRGAPEPAY